MSPYEERNLNALAERFKRSVDTLLVDEETSQSLHATVSNDASIYVAYLLMVKHEGEGRFTPDEHRGINK